MNDNNKARVTELDTLIEDYYNQLTELDNTKMRLYQELNLLQHEKSTLIVQQGILPPLSN